MGLGRPSNADARAVIWRELNSWPSRVRSRQLTQKAHRQLESEFDLAVARGEQKRLRLLIEVGLLRVHHVDDRSGY